MMTKINVYAVAAQSHNKAEESTGGIDWTYNLLQLVQSKRVDEIDLPLPSLYSGL